MSSDPATVPGTEERRRIVRGIRYCLLVFLAVRLGLFAVALVAPGLFTPLAPAAVPGWPTPPFPDPGLHNAVTAWERFDVLWFMRIAESGYAVGDGSAAFFPLFPLVSRAVGLLIGGPYGGGFVAANAALLGALVVLYFLTSSERSEEVARTTVLLTCLFPTSFFLFMPYSESLFLLLVVTSFWAARRDRWWLAGVMGLLAATTRSLGVVLAPALAVEALLRPREDRRALLPRLAASILPVVGLLLYLGYWQVRADDWLAPLNQQANWQRVSAWPWDTLIDGTRAAFRYVGAVNGGYYLTDWLLVLPVLVAALYAIRRYRIPYLVYVWIGLLLPLSYVFEGRPLMSMPRFVLPLFPAFWAIAEGAEGLRIPRWVAPAVGAAGLPLLAALTVNWYYIF